MCSMCLCVSKKRHTISKKSYVKLCGSYITKLKKSCKALIFNVLGLTGDFKSPRQFQRYLSRSWFSSEPEDYVFQKKC